MKLLNIQRSPFGWDDAAAIGGAAIGGITQLIGQDKRQQRQTQALQDIAIKGSKEMADYNQQIALQNQKATNPQAQVKMLKEAGLNPALLYGKGGSGGMSMSMQQGTGSSPSQAQAANAAQTSQAGQGMAMMLANIANTMADTANKEATTPKIQADTANTNTDTEQRKLDLKLGQETYDDRQKQIQADTSKKISEAQIATNNSTIGRETQEAEIRRIKQEAVNALWENEEQKSGIRLTNSKINEINNSIQQAWGQLEVNKYNAQSGRMQANVSGMNASTNAKNQLVNEMLGKWDIELRRAGLDTQQQQNFMRNMIDIGGMATGAMPKTETHRSESMDGNGNWQTRQGTTRRY